MVTINIGRKEAIFFGVVVLIAVVAGLVASYGGSQPDVMGHSAEELEGVCLSDGTNCPVSLGGGAPKAWFTWKRSSGILDSYGIDSVDTSGRPDVVFSTPMSSANYVVVCSGSLSSTCCEEQIYAHVKSTTGFTLRGSYAAAEDTINYLDCVVYGN
jgi:hypothetical protein